MEFRKILVVGAGTMGHGIAQAFAMGGYPVSLQDPFPQALERSDSLIKSSLETMLAAQLIRRDDIPVILKRIHLTADLNEAADGADLAIECIFENKEAKKTIFQQLDAACPAKTLLASNSTFLNIFDFVETSRPEKVLMAHWYAPPQIIPLVDVVKGPQTAEANIQSVANLLRKIGKKPVVFNKPLAGYVVSRLQVAFQREVYWLLDNNYVSAKELDEAAIWGLAMRMMVVGICQRIDFGGLDLSAKSLLQAPAQSTPLDYQPKKLLELVKQGALGVKVGRGFYDYKGKSEAEICRERDIRLLRLLKVLNENDIAGPLSYGN
jgi:3-hydroxybutyryl-CoA dehydrogenase